jgi:PqqA family protein
VATTIPLLESFARLAVEYPDREASMTWIKPEFEFVDLCSEVTSYLYHR